MAAENVDANKPAAADPGQVVAETTEPDIQPVAEVAAKVEEDSAQAGSQPAAEPQDPPAAAKKPPIGRTPGLLAIGVLIWAVMVVLVFAMGGRFEPPTIALGIAGIALIFAIWRLFRMVQALSEQPEYGLEGARTQGDKTRREDEFQRLLRGLKELEFDHEMGKISEEDFSGLEQAYRTRAIDLMQELDLQKNADDEGELHPELQEELDRRARELRLSFSGSDLRLEDDAGKTCSKCDGKNDPDAKFCKHCGKELVA